MEGKAASGGLVGCGAAALRLTLPCRSRQAAARVCRLVSSPPPLPSPPSTHTQFLLELFKQPGLTVTEQMTGIDHKIDPANLVRARVAERLES